MPSSTATTNTTTPTLPPSTVTAAAAPPSQPPCCHQQQHLHHHRHSLHPNAIITMQPSPSSPRRHPRCPLHSRDATTTTATPGGAFGPGWFGLSAGGQECVVLAVGTAGPEKGAFGFAYLY
ncbi:hypothetical protein Tco_0301518 [Tanacetum coccineum]